MSRTKQSDAPHMAIRKQLADYLTAYIDNKGMKQIEAAKLFGVQQPRISDLIRGKVDLFSIDTLVGFMDRISRRVEFEVIRTRKPKVQKVRRRRQRQIEETRVLPVHASSDEPYKPEDTLTVPADTPGLAELVAATGDKTLLEEATATA